MKKHIIKNSCGKKGCYISLRVLPYGHRDRKRRTINRQLKAARIPLVTEEIGSGK